LYHIFSIFPFIPGANAGTIEIPFPVDIAPISLTLDDQGIWDATTIDSTFAGIQIARFMVHDCRYRAKNDTVEVLFLNEDCVDTIEICPGEMLCASPNENLKKALWFLNSNAIYDNTYLAIKTPGVYQYLGLTMEDQLVLGCKLIVQEGIGCTGDFPDEYGPRLSPALLLSQGIIPFELTNFQNIEPTITWSGSGISDNWNEANNWIGNQLPSPCQQVIISVNETVIIENGLSVNIWSMLLENDALLIIDTAAFLQLIGL
jgi:hypothetical protein